MADLPTPSAKNDTGEFDRFTDFLRRLVAVPHSEINAQLDAEKAAKRKVKNRSASRVSGASSKKPN
ncbi:MAG: hypothetical protein WCA21_12285 [Terracidiphilus sp.]